MSHPLRLLHRLRQREVIPVGDDFASAFLFQFAVGIVPKKENPNKRAPAGV